MAKFLRRNWNRQLALGKRRKKKRVWRRPTGRDNKMREQRRGYPAVVGIGNKKKKTSRGKLAEKKPVMINNVKDLARIGKEHVGVVGSIGKKKKIEIAKKAKEMHIELWNINFKKFLKKNVKIEVSENHPQDSKQKDNAGKENKK